MNGENESTFHKTPQGSLIAVIGSHYAINQKFTFRFQVKMESNNREQTKRMLVLIKVWFLLCIFFFVLTLDAKQFPKWLATN